MLFRRYSAILCSLLCACLSLSELPPSEAAQRDQGSDSQSLANVKRAIELVRPDLNVEHLQVWERKDLEQDLSQIAGKNGWLISFYSLYDTDSFVGDGSVWAVVKRDSSAGSDALYSFEDSDDVEQASEKFNSLLSRVGPVITDEKSMNVAQLFLGCCAEGPSGETITDELGLRDSVANYYFRIYGNVWRGLDAYTEWWEAYEKSALDLAPRFAKKGSVRKINLERLQSSYGMHPQLQQWELAISSDGSVRVLGVKSIFPKQRQWLSYDFRSAIEP